jgi:hypothetical protein
VSEKKERSLSDRQVAFLCALVLKAGGSVSVTREEFEALDRTGPGARVHFTVTHDGTMTAEIVKRVQP